MNAVKGIAAGFVILVLVLALIAGLSTGQGREVFDNIVAAAQTTLNWTADQIGNLSNLLRTRGNSFRSLIAGVVLLFRRSSSAPPRAEDKGRRVRCQDSDAGSR